MAAAAMNFWKFKFLTVCSLERPILHNPAKFHRDRSIRCRDMAIFRFFKMTAVRHLGFWKVGILKIASLKVPTHVTMSNFVEIGQTVAEISRFNGSSKWLPPPSWIIKNSNVQQSVRSGDPICISLPNFIEIGQSVAEIWQFLDFPRWRPSAILDLLWTCTRPPTKSNWYSFGVCKIWFESAA